MWDCLTAGVKTAQGVGGCLHQWTNKWEFVALWSQNGITALDNSVKLQIIFSNNVFVCIHWVIIVMLSLLLQVIKTQTLNTGLYRKKKQVSWLHDSVTHYMPRPPSDLQMLKHFVFNNGPPLRTLKETYCPFFLSFSVVYDLLHVKGLQSLEGTTEAPFSHRKSCSWNVS